MRFPGDKVISVLKPREHEHPAAAVKAAQLSHSFTIKDEKWLERVYGNARADASWRNEEWHREKTFGPREHFPQHQKPHASITTPWCCGVPHASWWRQIQQLFQCGAGCRQVCVRGRRVGGQRCVWISSLSLLWQPVQRRLTCWSGLIM